MTIILLLVLNLKITNFTLTHSMTTFNKWLNLFKNGNYIK